MWTDGCRVAVAPGPLSPKCWNWWNPGLGNVWALSTLRVTPLALPGLLRRVLPCVPWTLLYPQPFLVVCDAVGSCHPCCEKLLDPSGSDTAAFGQSTLHRNCPIGPCGTECGWGSREGPCRTSGWSSQFWGFPGKIQDQGVKVPHFLLLSWVQRWLVSTQVLTL